MKDYHSHERRLKLRKQTRLDYVLSYIIILLISVLFSAGVYLALILESIRH